MLSSRNGRFKYHSQFRPIMLVPLSLDNYWSLRLWKTSLLLNPAFLSRCIQIKDESFLEDLNNILNSGDVPNIYQLDELDNIYTTMKPIVQDSGLPPTKANFYSAYTKLVRSNIHLVVCMRYTFLPFSVLWLSRFVPLLIRSGIFLSVHRFSSLFSSVYPSIHPSVHLSIHPSISPSIRPSCLPSILSFHPFLPSIHSFIHWCIY